MRVTGRRPGAEGLQAVCRRGPVMARFGAATGRYVYLEMDGVEYRVSFEEAGAGIPLLLLTLEL